MSHHLITAVETATTALAAAEAGLDAARAAALKINDDMNAANDAEAAADEALSQGMASRLLGEPGGGDVKALRAAVTRASDEARALRGAASVLQQREFNAEQTYSAAQQAHRSACLALFTAVEAPFRSKIRDAFRAAYALQAQFMSLARAARRVASEDEFSAPVDPIAFDGKNYAIHNVGTGPSLEDLAANAGLTPSMMNNRCAPMAMPAVLTLAADLLPSDAGDEQAAE
jgi:hypothetical protein